MERSGEGDGDGVVDKDLFDARMDLAKFWKERHDKRAEYEWKVMLAVWGVLLAAIVGLQRAERDWVFATVCIAFAGVFLFWLFALHRANYVDRKKAYHFAEEAQKELYDTFIPDKKPVPMNWGVWPQTLVTILLLLILYFVRVPIGPPGD